MAALRPVFCVPSGHVFHFVDGSQIVLSLEGAVPQLGDYRAFEDAEAQAIAAALDRLPPGAIVFTETPSVAALALDPRVKARSPLPDDAFDEWRRARQTVADAADHEAIRSQALIAAARKTRAPVEDAALVAVAVAHANAVAAQAALAAPNRALGTLSRSDNAAFVRELFDEDALDALDAAAGAVSALDSTVEQLAARVAHLAERRVPVLTKTVGAQAAGQLLHGAGSLKDLACMTRFDVIEAARHVTDADIKDSDRWANDVLLAARLDCFGGGRFEAVPANHDLQYEDEYNPEEDSPDGLLREAYMRASDDAESEEDDFYDPPQASPFASAGQTGFGAPVAGPFGGGGLAPPATPGAPGGSPFPAASPFSPLEAPSPPALATDILLLRDLRRSGAITDDELAQIADARRHGNPSVIVPIATFFAGGTGEDALVEQLREALDLS